MQQQDWHFSLELQSHTLRDFDPLLLLQHLFVHSRELEAHKEALYTVLAELYFNALDHGILQLDSALKHDVKGFADYYELREGLLNNLTEGYIQFSLQHISTPAGGDLIIEVCDSGSGFDYATYMNKAVNKTSPTTTYSGRGISLIRALCRELTYLEPGNKVRVLYQWNY